MNEAYTKLSSVVQTIQETINDLGPGQIQKIFSSRTQICLVLRFPGQTKYFLIGRGGSACGASFVDKNIDSQERLKDRFLDLMRNWLAGRRIYEVKSFFQGQGIHFKYNGEVSGASFFALWAKGKLHFAITRPMTSEFEAQSLVPWHNPHLQKAHLALSDEQVVELYENNIKANETQFSVLELDQQMAPTDRKAMKRKDKFYRRKVERINEDLEKIDQLIALQEKIKEINPDEIEEDHFQYGSHKLKMKKGLSFYQKRDYIFQKIKDYKVAKKILEKRLSLALEDLNHKDRLESVVQKNQKAFMPEWVQEKKEQKDKADPQAPDSIDRYMLSDGSVICHGKEARANEWLRSKWAKKEDYWFHLSDRSSGHAYLRSNQTNLSETIMSVIGSMLAQQNLSVSHGDVQLVYTQAKNIKGIKGRPGSVTMKKTKQITLQYRQNWKEIIANL